jgi:hypothetical protein
MEYTSAQVGQNSGLQPAVCILPGGKAETSYGVCEIEKKNYFVINPE